MRRRRCSRSCLRKSLRVVNLFVNLCGVGMIIYSLWLLKKWNEEVSQLSPSSRSNLPRPWFILACLGVGIIVCLITLCGHMVANCINKAVLCIYIVSTCSLVLLQGAVIIAIFFKMDLASQLNKYIDEANKSFKSFVMFHLYMCRVISIMALVLQINIVILAITIFFVGSEPLNHSNILDVPDFKHSFLISPYSTVNDDDEFSRTGTKFEFILGVTPIESYF